MEFTYLQYNKQLFTAYLQRNCEKYSFQMIFCINGTMLKDVYAVLTNASGLWSLIESSVLF